jgi:N-acetylneuraminic acid mutarotase
MQIFFPRSFVGFERVSTSVRGGVTLIVRFAGALLAPAALCRRAAMNACGQLVRPGLLIALASLCLSAAAQTGQWTWVGGNNTDTCSPSTSYNCSAPAVYGALGTAASTYIPGARYAAVGWTDSSGNLWLFGGQGAWFPGWNGDGTELPFVTAPMNDVWEFNPSTKEWAWMGGDVTPPNQTICEAEGEGSEGVLVTSSCGYPGVYGDLGELAAGNMSGSRYDAVAWSDQSNNLWVYGGVTLALQTNFANEIWGSGLNDMWEFSPSNGEWGWMGGQSYSLVCSSADAAYECPLNGVYTTVGTAGGQFPGARTIGATWTDTKGNLWMFGGSGEDGGNGGLTYGIPPPGAVSGWLNDLWEFSPTTLEWTWMGGNSHSNCTSSSGYYACGWPGVYGEQGDAASGNWPGAREGAATWTDASGNFWMFGGQGIAYDGTASLLNDLWEFSPSTDEWTWISGSSTNANYTPPSGVYGTLGVTSATNVPGARANASTWVDSKGRLWLFGGGGLDSVGTNGNLNDLWQFNPATGWWTWISGNKISPWGENGDVGIYGTQGTPAAGNHPGGRNSALSWTDSSGNLWLFGGSGSTSKIDYSSAGEMLNDFWEYQPSPAPPPPAITWATPAPIDYFTPLGATQLDASASVAGTYVYTPAAGEVLPIGVHTLSVTFNPSDTTDYASNTATVSLIVNEAAQTITFPALPSLTYGDAPFMVSATSSSGLTVSFASITPSICTISGTTVTVVGGESDCTIQATQAGNSIYSAAPAVTRSSDVMRETQSITFSTLASQTYGAAPFTVSATATSGLAVSFKSTTNTVCTVSGSTVTLVAHGTCSIEATQAGNTDFTAATAVTRSFVVGKESQTITFAALSGQSLGNAPFTLSATATSGLAVSFASTTPAVCTVSGKTVTMVAHGSCSIEATQTGDNDFAAAAAVTRSFVVGKESQTISFAALSGQTLGNAPFTVSATASSGLAVSFASTTPTVCTVSGSTVTLVAHGTCSIEATQAGNAYFAAATEVTRSFAVAND